MQRRLAAGVSPVWIAAHFVQKSSYQVFHAVPGGVVEWGVVEVLVPVAVVRIQGSPKLIRGLVDLHRCVFVAMEQVLLELGR